MAEIGALTGASWRLFQRAVRGWGSDRQGGYGIILPRVGFHSPTIFGKGAKFVAEIGALTGASAIINSIRGGEVNPCGCRRGSNWPNACGRGRPAREISAKRETPSSSLINKPFPGFSSTSRTPLSIGKSTPSASPTPAGPRGGRTTCTCLTSRMTKTCGEVMTKTCSKINRKLTDESFLQRRLLSSPEGQDFLTQQRFDADRQASDERFLSARQANAPGPEQSLPRGSIVDFQA